MEPDPQVIDKFVWEGGQVEDNISLEEGDRLYPIARTTDLPARYEHHHPR